MPDVEPATLNMSPLGKLLAVTGSYGGLQRSHFNEPSPSHVSRRFYDCSIGQIQWDNRYRLYPMSDPTNKLYVFEVTATSVNEAPPALHNREAE